MPKMGVLEKTEVSKFERKYQKFQNMKEMKSKQYMAPSIKVVKFQVEQGFAGSPIIEFNEEQSQIQPLTVREGENSWGFSRDLQQQ